MIVCNYVYFNFVEMLFFNYIWLFIYVYNNVGFKFGIQFVDFVKVWVVIFFLVDGEFMILIDLFYVFIFWYNCVVVF